MDELEALIEELGAWARTRSEPPELLRYGAHEDQLIELYRPAAGISAGLALVLHGGFWRPPYTRSTTAALCVALAGAGLAAANVEYRRLGPGAWRPMLDDVLAARTAVGERDEFEDVVAVGHSAGGHLGLWLAAEGGASAVVALGAVCDLAAAARAGLGRGAAQELLGGGPDELPAVYRVADPAARLPLRVSQRLLHGVEDDTVPVGHARAYAERAAAAGDDCLLVQLACGHFEPIDPRGSAGAVVLDTVLTIA